jgi:hypothetical protein
MDEILLKIFVSISSPNLKNALLYHTSPGTDTSLQDSPEDLEVVESTEGDPKAHKPPLPRADPCDESGEAYCSNQDHEDDYSPNKATRNIWERFCHIIPTLRRG